MTTMMPNTVRSIEAQDTSLRFEMDRMDAVDLFCVIEECQKPYSARLAQVLFEGIRSGHDPVTMEVVYNDSAWQSWYESFDDDIPSDWFTEYQMDLLDAFIRDVTDQDD